MIHTSDWVGPRIRARRVESGWTQRELAARVGTSIADVSRWENGHVKPTLAKIEDLAHVLGVRPAWLAFGDST